MILPVRIFSRAGFSRDLQEAAKQDAQVDLISLEEFLKPAA
ncbi:MAG TPA: hypothetical protein VIR57_01470 [Chloroflexota bacterium]